MNNLWLWDKNTIIVLEILIIVKEEKKQSLKETESHVEEILELLKKAFSRERPEIEF